MMARLHLQQQTQQHQQQPQQQQQQQQQQQWTSAGLAAPETPEAVVQRVQGTVEYTQEIVNEMFLNEPLFRALVNYMDSQLEINGRMRGILVDWLVEVHMKYRCQPESLYLTINLIDRYLSRVTVARNRLQLVGVAAMLIATKFEEINPPDIGDFVYITDNAYTKEQVLQMECTMLTTLSFQIVVPTAAHFLDWFLQSNRCGAVQRELCRYLVELALLQYEMLPYPASLLVAAAVLLSNELITRPSHLADVAPYDETQLRACANELRALLEAAPTSSLQTVRRRYGLQQHHSVAGMSFPRVI
jgi:cyclin B